MSFTSVLETDGKAIQCQAMQLQNRSNTSLYLMQEIKKKTIFG